MDKSTPILITGASGLVGSHFLKHYANKYRFLNMDLTTNIDITNKQQVEDFISKHASDKQNDTSSSSMVLIHLAAFTNVSSAFEQQGDKEGICYKVNVEGTRNIAESCRRYGIYMIHISTDFVFSGKKREAYTEKDSRDPIEWYGQTKAWAEEIVESTLKKYAIVRIGYPFRDDKYDIKPDIVTKILNNLRTNSLPPQFTDTVITPTPIKNLSQIFDKLIQSRPIGIFHAHGSTPLSPYQLAQKVARVFGYDPNIIKKGSLTEYLKTTNRPYQQYLHMDNSKIQQTLNITIPTIDESLEEIEY